MVEVKISKNNLFVVIAVIAILGSIFAVYAYGTSNPAVFGHSAGELEGGGGGTSCLSGQVAVGSSCKNLPTCATTEVLSYDGNYFACKTVSTTSTQTLKWTKVCNPQSLPASPTSSTPNCVGTGLTYGENIRFGKIGGTYNDRVCVTGGTSALTFVTSCTENNACTTSGQFCVSGSGGSGATGAYPNVCGTGTSGFSIYTNPSATIYKCILR